MIEQLTTIRFHCELVSQVVRPPHRGKTVSKIWHCCTESYLKTVNKWRDFASCVKEILVRAVVDFVSLFIDKVIAEAVKQSHCTKIYKMTFSNNEE